MTSNDQLDLDTIEAVVRNAAQIGADIDPATAAALADEVRRLRARLADEERQHGQTIDDRDHFHDMADKLAYAIAPEEVIGEHSSMNCPWENALDLVTPAAKVDKLRARVAELEGHASDTDTLPAWLAQRFDPRGPGWDALSDDDRTYWEHHARAVRRAVARGGFKAPAVVKGGAR